jgi:hypothetical protein
MKRLPLLGGMALLVGCGGGDSTGPPTVPDLAGTYQGEFVITSSSAVANRNLGTFPASATISQQKSNLSIVIVAPQGGALSFSGTIVEGGAITLDSETGLTFLAGVLPQCSFTGAVATNSAVRDRGRLFLTANIVGASCPRVEGEADSVPTTFLVRFEGT